MAIRAIFVRESKLQKLEKRMRSEGVESFVVSCCMDTTNKIHIPSEKKEYSNESQNLKDMPSWLVEEIFEAMRFKKSFVILERVGRTMYVKVGRPL